MFADENAAQCILILQKCWLTIREHFTCRQFPIEFNLCARDCFCTLVCARAAIRAVPAISTVTPKPCAFGYLASNVFKALSRALVSGTVMNDVSLSSRFPFGTFSSFTTCTCTSPPKSAAAKALLRSATLEPRDCNSLKS